MIENVHDRELPVAAVRVGSLLDGLGRPGDELWPAPPWPALVLDRPPGVGADGGHGPIRYTCTGHVPGREVSFAFHPSSGVAGGHTFSVLDGPDPERCVLRGEPRGVIVSLRWALVVRWLHDALIEDLLDRAAVAVGHPPSHPARWSPWVRLLMAALGRVDTAVLAGSRRP